MIIRCISLAPSKIVKIVDCAAVFAVQAPPATPGQTGDPHPVQAGLPMQDEELVTQREDLRVFPWLLIVSRRGSANTFVTPR
jgi:hypothetical protein